MLFLKFIFFYFLYQNSKVGVPSLRVLHGTLALIHLLTTGCIPDLAQFS